MNKQIIIFGVAILLALLVSVLAYNRLQKKTKAQPAPIETQPVAIAAGDLSWGTALTAEMIKMAPYLKKSLPPGTTFSSPSALEGRVLIYPVKANEPIFESRLAPTTVKEGGVAAIITPKKRALAVKVDREIGVAGFIHPGNRIDVLVTISQNEERSSFITKKVLENILVLATGPHFETTGKQEKPVMVEVVSLEVTPEEAEKLAFALTQGKIQLTLRNSIDNEHVFTRGVTIPLLLASSQTVNESKSDPGQVIVFPVELIKGVIVSKLIFEKGEQ